jgi:hypothetical protein
MKLLRKIALSIFLVQASIASAFSFGSGVSFHPPLKAGPTHTISRSGWDPSVSNPLVFQRAKQSPIEGTVSVTPTYPETGVAYVDSSDAFTNNVFCPTPVITAHTIYVCSGSAFQYKVPAGGVNNEKSVACFK